ncbi:hypothetical protein HX770_11580 [Vibrio parahaemolyticus]|nr:hypothetical protein [Vibrio parahaemolyticus]QLE30244.1 hypothetical protein FDV78_06455 [Vibrio parahaemolyticus]
MRGRESSILNSSHRDGKHGGVGHMLRLISQAKDTLTAVFENGTIQETHENANDLRKLKEARVVIVTSRGYRVHPKMEALMNYFLETEASSFLGTQHAERIPEIRDLAQEYLEAKLKGKRGQEAERFNTLEGVVYEITMDLEESCRRLRNRINYDFGYGRTLAYKLKENQVAINQAEKLVSGMKAFTYKLLLDIASDDVALNALLCFEMHRAINSCQQELSSILSQLRILMMKYRSRERDKDLISAFDRYLDEEPYWIPSEEVILPDEIAKQIGEPKFWLSKPLELAHYPNTDDPNQESELSDIVDKITTGPAPEREKPDLKPAEIREFRLDVETRELIDVDIDSHCDSFFAGVYTADRRSKVSALDYYRQINKELPDDLDILTCAEDVWLFSILNYHSSMLPEDRKDFVVDPIGAYTYGEDDSDFAYGNLHLEDVSISRKI